jgi:hypothetical protein
MVHGLAPQNGERLALLPKNATNRRRTNSPLRVHGRVRPPCEGVKARHLLGQGGRILLAVHWLDGQALRPRKRQSWRSSGQPHTRRPTHTTHSTRGQMRSVKGACLGGLPGERQRGVLPTQLLGCELGPRSHRCAAGRHLKIPPEPSAHSANAAQGPLHTSHTHTHTHNTHTCCGGCRGPGRPMAIARLHMVISDHRPDDTFSR